MNNTCPFPGRALLAIACLMMAAESTAQPIAAARTAPSAVNETAPVTQLLSGALFFGQQQRARMDRMRKTGVNSSQDGATDDVARSVLNGFVKRSDGQSAIWVDGQIRHNVQNASVNQLNPSDVGGSSKHVKVVMRGTFVPPSAKALNVSKPVTTKNLRKRPAKKKQ